MKRDDFLLDDGIAYLNHASFGATPRRVLEAQQAIQRELETQPMAFYDTVGSRIRAAMEPVAATLGADPADVAFVDNASTGVSAVLRSLDLGPDDAVLTTSHAYAAVATALRWVARTTGCQLRVAEVPWPLDDAQQVAEAVQEAWRPDVKVAVLDHVASVSAVRFPLERLIPWLHERGTRVLVDGAHVPGQVEVDLSALGADWWTGNLHKWAFTPKGCAVLHAAPDAQDMLTPPVLSLYLEDGFVRAFEKQGTRDPSAWLAAPTAWAFVAEDGGWAAVRERNDAQARRIGALVEEELGLVRLAPWEVLHHMVPFELPGVAPTRAAVDAMVRGIWRQHRVQLWCMPLMGRVVLRLSAQGYVSDDDLLRAVAALRGALQG